MNGTILLVEDNEDDVLFLRRALRLAGIPHPLQVVPDGRQAIKAFGAYWLQHNTPPPWDVYAKGLAVPKPTREKP